MRVVGCLVLVSLAGVAVGGVARPAKPRTTWRLLTGAYSSVIATLEFDARKGAVTVLGQCDSGPNPSWVASHPTLPHVHYSTNEIEIGGLSSFTSSKPQDICARQSSAESTGDAPAHLAVIRGGTEIMAMNYFGGNGVSYTLTGPKKLGFAEEIKIGPFATAEGEVSHPHQVWEYGREVLVPDLGLDKIWRLAKVGKQWVTTGFIPQPLGSGPRHIQTKGSLVFVLHELSNTLAAQVIPVVPSFNSTKTLSSLSVLPPDVPGAIPAGRFHAAELILHPHLPYLYASNRDTAQLDTRGDAIAIVHVHPRTGELTLVKHVFSNLKLLRGLSLSPDGRYIAGGGQGGGGVVVWEIVEGGKSLKEVARNSTAPAATAFVWL